MVVDLTDPEHGCTTRSGVVEVDILYGIFMMVNHKPAVLVTKQGMTKMIVIIV